MRRREFLAAVVAPLALGVIPSFGNTYITEDEAWVYLHAREIMNRSYMLPRGDSYWVVDRETGIRMRMLSDFDFHCQPLSELITGLKPKGDFSFTVDFT